MSKMPAPGQNPAAPVIIAGMHRSGTSLAASLLESAGLDIGQRLMEGNFSNPRGHFEDLDFVELHKDALERLGLHTDGWALAELPPLPDDLMERARNLLAEKNQLPRSWGFKDPRGTLFIPVWASLSPQTRFVFVHRVPWEVVDSLYRRGDAAFSADPELAIQVWLYYNRAILDFSSRAPERCFFVNIETIIEFPVEWVAAVSAHAGLGLRAPDPSICDHQLLHSGFARARAGVVVEHFPEAIRIFGALEARAWRPAGAPALPFRAGSTPETERRLALQDWQAACAVARERDELLARASEQLESSGEGRVVSEARNGERGETLDQA
jgi:hypothetical protein